MRVLRIGTSVKETHRVSDDGEIVTRIETECNQELIRLYEEKEYAGVLSMPRGFNAQKGDSNG